MPVSADLFPDLFAPFTTTASFTSATIEAVEKTLFEKNGKPYLKCLVRGKDVMAKPEEVVRQLWLHTLIYRYKYPSSRIQVEYPVTFGRDTSKRADIVIMDADRPTVPYVIIEVKQGRMKDGKEQLKSYTHATGAPLAVWSDGIAYVVWHRKNPNYFEVIPALPRANETIEMIAGQPWTIDKLLEFENERDAQGSKAVSLRQLIEDLEDEVLANAGVDVFEEVFKLIFTKLFDELSCYSEHSPHLRFRNINTAASTKKAIQELFDEARERWDGVFDDDKIRLTPEHLQVCVGSLEQWKLFNSNLDVVDEAFEYLVNKSSKGEKGQYFTPRWVIDLCVKMLNPKESETIIDTACGSAGFTVHSIFHVWKAIFKEMGKPESHLFTMEKKPARCAKYVQDKVFAIDFDEKSVRVSRCLNLIAGDGQTNVLHLNTLDYKRWDETTKQQDWSDIYHEGWKKLRKLMAEKNDYRAFGFDVLMANPPFAGDIKQTDMLSPYELAHKRAKDGGQGKLESAVGRDLLFIERNLDFLKPGGRMAVVLPQGRFNNSSDQRVREYIAERCRILAVVGVHGNTFKPHTGTKTSVLFVQKWNDDKDAGPICKKVKDYPIFFATQRLPSKDNSGDKIYVNQTLYVGYDRKQNARVALPEKEFVAHFGTLDAADLFSARVGPEGPGLEWVRGQVEEMQEKQKADNDRPITWKFAALGKRETRQERLRDTHGHWVVQHDFFNHDGLTQNGIAEAFEEFAAKEKLSFF
ncbi:MAG: N-6 DNA methylase [Prosthecobacter sp.]|uniref:N-6 DNA methylase n=1 Tax=Prosthecobacter sp. TaxID=1965333 RepID=UPI003BB1454F